MSIVAIITARGGSKRIPKKNIKDFMGKPMLAYAIDAAIKADIFDEIMVSTDDNEIAEVAKKYGAKVPFMRSEKTANDFAITEDVLFEVLDEYKKLGKTFDAICCIYPCVPLLKAENLKEAYDKFKNTECDSLTPVVRFSFPIQRALKVNSKGYIEYREPKYAFTRSQDIEPMFHDVGMFYFSKTESLLKERRIVGNRPIYTELDESQIQDIDTEADWKMAETKYRILNNA